MNAKQKIVHEAVIHRTSIQPNLALQVKGKMFTVLQKKEPQLDTIGWFEALPSTNLRKCQQQFILSVQSAVAAANAAQDVLANNELKNTH